MFLIDYFSATLNFKGITYDYVLELLNLKKYEQYFLDIGSHSRYEHCYKFGNINILVPYEKRSDMGFFINLTGQGCREYENCFNSLYGNEFDWSTLFKKLIREVNIEHTVNITRIDLAFDNFKGVLNMNVIEQKLLDGEYVSRFKKWTDIEVNRTNSKKGSLGRTFYIGSKSSMCYCKFYDKLAEQKLIHKKDDLVMAKLNDMKQWIRFEITFKDSLAMLICNMLTYSKDVDTEVAEYVNRCFRFVDLTKNNISRCPMSDFWERFMNTDNRSTYKVVKSDLLGYDKTYLWFKKSLCPTLFALMNTYDNRSDFISEIAHEGAMRLNEKHMQIVNGISTGRKLSNAEQWKENNPFYNVDYDDNLKVFEDYKQFKY